MKKNILIFFIIGTFLGQWIEGYAFEIRGNFSGQGRIFFNDPLFDKQKKDSVSLSGEVDLYHEWDNFNITFIPFFRIDSTDAKRRHFDIRELKYFQSGNNWELRVGLEKIFWGVTESQHLVDIINQTDLVESLDGEEKLGQPMVYFSLPLEYGTWDFFMLPYFRERTFPGEKGRLRSSLVVDTDNPVYEDSAKERHIDVAMRYSHTLESLDIGLSCFFGTSREPAMTVGFNNNEQPVLRPFYKQIYQIGLDLQWIYDAWLLKFEGIHRIGQENRKGNNQAYGAFTTGFEYTFSGLGSGMDVGFLSEWLYDSRNNSATTPFENDIMTGLRVAVNDIQGTEFLVGGIYDLEGSSQSLSFEGSRRLSDFWKFTLEANIIIENNKDEILYDFRKDDFIECNFMYYF